MLHDVFLKLSLLEPRTDPSFKVVDLAFQLGDASFGFLERHEERAHCGRHSATLQPQAGRTRPGYAPARVNYKPPHPVVSEIEFFYSLAE